MSLTTILVGYDERRVLDILKQGLIGQGYPVLEAQGRDDVLQKLRDNRPGLVLLGDGSEISGPELCREIRTGSDVPVIVLTTRSTEHEKVLALDAGADDYVVRPAGIQEVLARVRAALRRAAPLKGQLQFTFSELAIDFERRDVCVRGVKVHLTPKEFHLCRGRQPYGNLCRTPPQFGEASSVRLCRERRPELRNSGRTLVFHAMGLNFSGDAVPALCPLRSPSPCSIGEAFRSAAFTTRQTALRA
jgi:CheY-like chemotaxis protein